MRCCMDSRKKNSQCSSRWRGECSPMRIRDERPVPDNPQPSLQLRRRHMMRTHSTFLPCLLAAVLLAGCASMNPSAPPIATVDPVTLGATAATVDWPNENWWHRYGDVQLDQLIAEGLAGSPPLAAARVRIARADAAAGIARSALFPQVAGAAT